VDLYITVTPRDELMDFHGFKSSCFGSDIKRGYQILKNHNYKFMQNIK